jgi:hypothetical protein
MSDDDDCAAIFGDLPPIERATAIAAVLRKGNPSRRFCRLLAAMIDGEKNFTKLVLTLGRNGPGQPATSNVELGKAMVAATAGVPRGNLKAVTFKVASQFGVSVRTARDAMSAVQWDDEKRRDREAIEREGIQEPDGKELD